MRVVDVIAAVMVFSGLAAAVCAKARAAAPALLFGVVAVVLFCFTPMGAGLPGAVASVSEWVGGHAGSAVAHGGAR